MRWLLSPCVGRGGRGFLCVWTPPALTKMPRLRAVQCFPCCLPVCRALDRTINPTAYSGQDQDPSNETIVDLWSCEFHVPNCFDSVSAPTRVAYRRQKQTAAKPLFFLRMARRRAGSKHPSRNSRCQWRMLNALVALELLATCFWTAVATAYSY